MSNYYVHFREDIKFHVKDTPISVYEPFLVCVNNEIKARAIARLLNRLKFGYQYKEDDKFNEQTYKEVINDYPELFAV